jgi:hypothetical protein
MRSVAHMPECATLRMAWKTAGLSDSEASGTNGLVMPRATSHSRLAPSTWTVLTVREEDLVACSVLGQLAWLAAILEKEMPADGCTNATPGIEGGEDFCLPPRRALALSRIFRQFSVNFPTIFRQLSDEGIKSKAAPPGLEPKSFEIKFFYSTTGVHEETPVGDLVDLWISCSAVMALSHPGLASFPTRCRGVRHVLALRHVLPPHCPPPPPGWPLLDPGQTAATVGSSSSCSGEKWWPPPSPCHELLAVVGGEQVRSGAQHLLVRYVCLQEQDAELPVQLVEE